MAISPASIIEYWYSEPLKKHWFASTPALDKEIRDKFEDLWQKAASGALNHWTETAEGALALVIILDQFPLNMFRNHAKSFQTEQLAVAIARQAIDNKLDPRLAKERLPFLYMPLMHSENLADQDLSVRLYELAGLESNLRFARHHREIIRQFGRFPHRNSILNRHSTIQEREYLNSKHAFKG